KFGKGDQLVCHYAFDQDTLCLMIEELAINQNTLVVKAAWSALWYQKLTVLGMAQRWIREPAESMLYLPLLEIEVVEETEDALTLFDTSDDHLLEFLRPSHPTFVSERMTNVSGLGHSLRTLH
ncbi:MAG TPA: hypothetical protein VD998_03050, partial [Verrucomicrobiae bacterium]|nr:hypothetical protein [Verrucomicrobiae bacterium]